MKEKKTSESKEEESASDLNLQLEEALLSAELAAKEAHRANEAKSLYLATMSHELRTPLNGLIGMADMLELTDLDSDQQRYLEVIKASSRQLLSVLNDVLDFSKIESGRLELEVVAIKPLQILEESARLFEVAAGQKNLELRIKNHPSLNEAFPTDPVRFRQIMVNLVSNAVKYTDEGSVVLRGWREEGEDGTISLCIEVEDTGEGIDSDLQPYLFVPYYQAKSSTPRNLGGTGLGLAIAKQLVEALGGEISYDTEPGKGSKFSFYLVGSESEASTPKKVASTPAGVSIADHYPLSVLAAEDNRLNALVLEVLLKQCGYEPEMVTDGRKAVEAWKARRHELVILDCQMPEMDGLAAGQEIRRLSGSEDLPYLVALSAHSREFKRAKEPVYGMNESIEKPLSRLHLEAMVARAGRLRKRRGT